MPCEAGYYSKAGDVECQIIEAGYYIADGPGLVTVGSTLIDPVAVGESW